MAYWKSGASLELALAWSTEGGCNDWKAVGQVRNANDRKHPLVENEKQRNEKDTATVYATAQNFPDSEKV